jgi:Ca2+/H+ antiporter, TMEM165/GDT1 family
MTAWTTAGPAIAASFLASLVEVVEAFTVVLAVSAVRGWRPAMLGATAGLAILVVIVLVFGAAIDSAPLGLLQLLIGALLLLFGLRWLRKAILRAAGIIDRRDEARAFDGQIRELREEAQREKSRLDWLAGAAACKSVVVEGVEVVFIVVAIGAGRGLLIPASLGAAAACAMVLAVGIVVRRPLARVPENALKFGVGVLLSSFGAFWTGEGLGVDWPGADLAIPAFVVIFAATALILVGIVRPRPAEATR